MPIWLERNVHWEGREEGEAISQRDLWAIVKTWAFTLRGETTGVLGTPMI